AAILTVNSIKFLLEFVRDPKNKDLTAQIVKWLDRHPDVIGLTSILLFLIWVMHAWSKTRFSDQWEKAWRLRSRDELLKPVQEKLRNNQEVILSHFTAWRKSITVLAAASY